VSPDAQIIELLWIEGEDWILGSRYVGDGDRTVQTIALACGAAGEFLVDAARANADVFLTGEMRFHDCLAAEAHGLGVLLPGHYATERFAMEELAKRLKNDAIFVQDEQTMNAGLPHVLRCLADFGAPYGHGLVQLGLDAGRLLLVETKSDKDALWALEEALRSQARPAMVAGAVAGGLDLTTSRRLNLAAATHAEAVSKVIIVSAHDNSLIGQGTGTRATDPRSTGILGTAAQARWPRRGPSARRTWQGWASGSTSTA
jgi:hypothetical protein